MSWGKNTGCLDILAFVQIQMITLSLNEKINLNELRHYKLKTDALK